MIKGNLALSLSSRKLVSSSSSSNKYCSNQTSPRFQEAQMTRLVQQLGTAGWDAILAEGQQQLSAQGWGV
jgi:hypothetical protein